jgi:TonB family protein
MRFRARCSIVVTMLLAGVCAASIPPQTLGPHRKARSVSDDDWMPRFDAHNRCPAVLPPEPLTTPMPVLPNAGRRDLKISFVIGVDGRLHKLAVINSAGRAADSRAFSALRQWRYKPATCQGVPIEAEGTVEFPVELSH